MSHPFAIMVHDDNMVAQQFGELGDYPSSFCCLAVADTGAALKHSRAGGAVVSHRYRLYPTTSQMAVLHNHCRDARFVWNLALEQMNLWSTGRTPADMRSWDRQLADARQAFSWLASGSSSVQQGALRDLRQSFRNWWSRPDHFGRPTWRKQRINEGFVVRDLTVNVLNRQWAAVLVPKAGLVRFRLSRPLPDNVRSARVTYDRAGRWHVSILAPQTAVERTRTGYEAGIDLGVASSVATSNGNVARMPKLLSPGQVQRKRRLQRRLTRQQPGSNRRQRTKTAIARLSALEADRRKNWIEQVTTDLVRSFDLIVIENLNVRGMTRSARGTVSSPGRNVAQKRGLNRAILAQAWGLFRRRLTDKATSAGVELIAVNPAYTSQRCHKCGHTASESRKSQAVFHCINCDYWAHADVNAACNILAAGRAVAGPGGTSHAVPAKRPDETSTNPEAA